MNGADFWPMRIFSQASAWTVRKNIMTDTEREGMAVVHSDR